MLSTTYGFIGTYRQRLITIAYSWWQCLAGRTCFGGNLSRLKTPSGEWHTARVERLRYACHFYDDGDSLFQDGLTKLVHHRQNYDSEVPPPSCSYCGGNSPNHNGKIFDKVAL